MKNNIEKIENLHWKWRGNLEPLGKMPNNKLEFIRNFVMNHRGFYSNMSSDDWAESIKYLIDFRKTKKNHYSVVQKISNIIEKSMI
jgi:hypothetical protein